MKRRKAYLVIELVPTKPRPSCRHTCKASCRGRWSIRSSGDVSLPGNSRPSFRPVKAGLSGRRQRPNASGKSPAARKRPKKRSRRKMRTTERDNDYDVVDEVYCPKCGCNSCQIRNPGSRVVDESNRPGSV